MSATAEATGVAATVFAGADATGLVPFLLPLPLIASALVCRFAALNGRRLSFNWIVVGELLTVGTDALAIAWAEAALAGTSANLSTPLQFGHTPSPDTLTVPEAGALAGAGAATTANAVGMFVPSITHREAHI